MEAIEALMGRRSIRAYTDEDISDEALDTILQAAMAAPSACNQQPWEFIVVKDRDILGTVPTFQPFSSMLPSAACGIFVCGNTDALANPTCAPYWVQDCAAATQNILLAAHALGLGAVWLGAYPTERICKSISTLLSVPEGVTPFSIVALGVPAENKGPASRYDKARIHLEKW